MTTKSPSEYSTADLYLAAYLITAGVTMKRQDPQAGNRLHFVFDATLSNLDELKAAWYSGAGKVSAIKYSHNIKDLKGLCHSR